MTLVHIPNFREVSGLEDRGGGDNNVHSLILGGGGGDKRFKELR